MTDKFPEINCRKPQKRQRIIVTLQELGVIRRVINGKLGICTTRWTLGDMAEMAVAASAASPK